MDAPLIWTDHYKVHSYHSDRYGKLRINVIAIFLQESAWLHSNACGIGYKDLREIGKLWILSGIKIKVDSYPSWGDELTMNTWGNEYEDPFAYRDFEILDKTGKQIICGSTSWLLINESNHRPNRITEEYQKIPHRGVGSGSGRPARLDAQDVSGIGETRIINYSDIDIYQHVNNAKYVEFCADLVPVKTWESKELKEITVNYLGESLHNNVLRFNMTVAEEYKFLFTAYNETLKREVIRAEFHFRKKTFR